MLLQTDFYSSRLIIITPICLVEYVRIQRLHVLVNNVVYSTKDTFLTKGDVGEYFIQQKLAVQFFVKAVDESKMMLQINTQIIMFLTLPVCHTSCELENQSLSKRIFSFNRRTRILYFKTVASVYLSRLNQLSMGSSETKGNVCKAPKGILLPGTPGCFATIQTSQPHALL